MRTVWKYPIKFGDTIELIMPFGAQILKFDTQDGVLMIWALVYDSVALQTRRFRLVGTGHPLPDYGLVHIGTCFHGPFVWHLFEVNE